jgi:hypothetical protein
MAQHDAQQRVIEEWLRLPETRRRHATDAVAFAFRLLQDQPELLNDLTEEGYQLILDWLSPHLSGEPARGA